MIQNIKCISINNIRRHKKFVILFCKQYECIKIYTRTDEKRKVKLSDETKEYLVAYKVAEEATTIVIDQVNGTWGKTREDEQGAGDNRRIKFI